MGPESMGVKDNPTPPTTIQVNAQYHPVVMGLLRLPSFQITAVQQIELDPREP